MSCVPSISIYEWVIHNLEPVENNSTKDGQVSQVFTPVEQLS